MLHSDSQFKSVVTVVLSTRDFNNFSLNSTFFGIFFKEHACQVSNINRQAHKCVKKCTGRVCLHAFNTGKDLGERESLALWFKNNSLSV